MGNTLSIIGLSLDIIGVGILFFYGMPPKYNNGYVQTMPDKEFKRKEWISKSGFLLIITGFILQLIPYLLPSK